MSRGARAPEIIQGKGGGGKRENMTRGKAAGGEEIENFLLYTYTWKQLVVKVQGGKRLAVGPDFTH